LVAEFLGTYILVLTVGCNVLAQTPVWGGVSIACSLMVMIYALGGVSGANFNPAVSFALGMTKKMSWDKVGMYMGVQLLGGLAAGFTYSTVFGSSFILAPTEGHTFVQAALAEIIYTFMLCFIVLNVACSNRDGGGKNQYYGLAIGFVIVAAAYSGGAISMGCFNPAVAFGIDISSGHKGLGNCLTYSLCEFVGAALAAVFFWVVRPDEPDAPFRIGSMEGDQYPLASKLVSEFLGTFMLVLTVGLNVLNESTAAVFSIASSLMCMIFALGSVSGAHFNPAVTVAIMASGRNKISTKEGGMYMAVQILAGICASFMYALMKGGQTFQLKPATSTWPQAMFGEFMYTFVLAFVVLSVATVKKENVLSEFFGLAIGMCVTTGGLAIGSLSGGSLNPAVSFGISTSHIIGGGGFYPCLIYSVVELIAGVAAAGVFMVTAREEYPEMEKLIK